MVYMQKVKKSAILFYVLFLIFTYFFVKEALNEKKLSVTEKKEEKKEATKVVPVNTKLFIEFSSYTSTFNLKMKSTNSVLDVLNELRNNKRISYEVDEYTFGFKIAHINNNYSDDNSEWRIFYKEKDVTSSFDKTPIEDDTEIIIRKVPKKDN
jgi:hypothetical protein